MINKETIKTVLTNRTVRVGALLVVSAAAGAGSTYLVLVKKLEIKYAALSEKEIAEAKEYYDRQYKVGSYSNPVDLADELVSDGGVVWEETSSITTMVDVIDAAKEIAENGGYISYDKPEQTVREKIEVVDSVRKNIFDEKAPISEPKDFNLDNELDKKNAGKPYIVKSEYFFENDLDYVQTTLTYFEGDEILVDEKDQPIRNFGPVVGEDNFRFGCGSSDVNVVYIYNDRFKAGYEITRHTGYYTQEVLGYLQHSEKIRTRKMRSYDDN